MNPAGAVWLAPAVLAAVTGASGSWLQAYQRAERLRQGGAYAAAEAEYQSALLQAPHGEPCPAVAVIDTGLAALHQTRNRLREAETAATQALKLWAGCPSPHPHETAATLRTLAVIRSDQGRYPESVALFQKALAALPGGASNAASRADITSQLGAVYFLQRKLAEADSSYQLSLELNESADPPDRLVRAAILDKVGELHLERRNYSAAQECFESALEIRERGLGPQHPASDGTRIHLARLYYARGLWSKAERIFRAALESSTARLGDAHPRVISLRNDLGVLYRSEGKTRQAEVVFRKAITAWEASGDSHAVYAIALLLNLGSLVEEQGHSAEAEKEYRRALSILEGAGPAAAAYGGTAWNHLGRLQYGRHDPVAAAESFRKAVQIWDETLGAGHPRSASGLHNLAVVEIAQGRFSEAETHLKAALDIWERSPESSWSAAWAACLRDYAEFLKGQGRTQEAAGVQARAAALEARIREKQRLARMTVDVHDLPGQP